MLPPSPSIHVSAMADADDHNGKLSLDNLIDDAVFPETQAIRVLGALEFPYASGKWVVRQSFDGLDDTRYDLSVDPFELPRALEGFHSIR